MTSRLVSVEKLIEQTAALAELRAENERLARALTAAQSRPSGRCIYCGEPTKSRYRVCADHRDIIE